MILDSCYKYVIFATVKIRMRKILSFILVAAFFIAADPGHLIHEFAGHHDTEECHSPDVTSISVQHIHCDIFQLSLPAFSGISVLNFADSFSVGSKIFLKTAPSKLVIYSFRKSGRAPPLFI